MDEDFRQVAYPLDDKDPCIIAPQPPAHGLPIAYVKTEPRIIVREQPVPALIGAHTLASKYRHVKTHLEQAHARAPDVEIAIAAGFDSKEHHHEQSDENQR